MDLNKSDYHQAFNLNRFKQICSELYALEHPLSYDKFTSSAGKCADYFQASGLIDVETIPMPADGESAFMDFIMPQAWELEEASLQISLDGMDDWEITSLKRDNYCVANRCPPTPPEGISAALILWEDVVNGVDPQGKIVLSDNEPPSHVHKECVRLGAVALVSGFTEAKDGKYKDSTFWINGWGFPYWYHTKEDRILPVFSITPHQANELKRLIRSRIGIKAKAIVKSKLYSGQLFSVSGVIPGSEQGEIVIMAHLYEPFLNDNHSGVAALMELARMLVSGLESGWIPPLQKSVRFLATMEQYGVAHYFSDEARRERTLLAINLDCISYCCEETGGPVAVHSSPDSLPFATDLLFHDWASRYLHEHPLSLRPGDLEDDSFVSDRTIGIPSHYILSVPGNCHHNGQDEFDRITDWRLAEDITCFIAAYVQAIGSADQAKQDEMFKQTTQLALCEVNTRFGELGRAVDAGSLDGQDAIERLRFFVDWQLARVKLFPRFFFRPAADFSIDDLSLALSRKADELASGFSQLGIRRRSDIEQTAKSIVPVRKGVGFPASLAKVPSEEKFKHPPSYYHVLNWLDGHTSLFEALRKNAAACQAGNPSDEQISNFIAYIELLESFGYVEGVTGYS